MNNYTIICTLIAMTKYFLDLFAKERRGGGSNGRITRLVNSTRPLMQKLAMYVIVVALHLSDLHTVWVVTHVLNMVAMEINKGTG